MHQRSGSHSRLILFFTSLKDLWVMTRSTADASELLTRMLLPVVANISVSVDISPGPP